ncbi:MULTISPECIES: FimV family protein [unclassified Achromobacter]|uniref:type IV pilus assembly protein FimV n=1 Tax=unclassified Achromobacter TaxID=2626865 RepID=UPI001302ED1B|nr:MULTISPECIES: FimV/HubP family polar landmark protein [unclassified Achromobacter]
MTSRTARLSSRSSLTATRCAMAVLLTASAVAVQPAWAARLGHSRVVSAQNAPLQVVIPLTDLTPDEQASLRIAVADADAWQRAGLKPPVPLGSLRLAVQTGADASQRIVRLTSAEVATDPAVDVLLSVGSGAGQRLVQLTVMQTAKGFPGLNSQATVGTGARAGGGGGNVAVREGDTLYGIAQSHALADATIYQMLVALWRANPQAFIGNNMNRVKAGARLVVPDASTVRAIDPGEARRIFLEQAEAYARYRAGLAGAAGRGAAAAPAPTTSGQIGAGAPAAQADTGAQDRLRLSSGVPGQAGQGAEDAAQSRADAETSNAKATQDAKSRVDELERNVKDLNAALAQQKQGAQGAGDGSGLAVAGLTLPGGPGAAAQSGQRAGASGANGQGAAGLAANGQAGANGSAGAGGQGAVGGQAGAAGQAGAGGQAGAAAAGNAAGQSGAAGTGTGTGTGDGAGTGAGAGAGAGTGTGTDANNSAAGSATNAGAPGSATSGAAPGSGAAGASNSGGTTAAGTSAAGTNGSGGATGATSTAGGTGAGANGAAGATGANGATGATGANGATGVNAANGAPSPGSGTSTAGANAPGSATVPGSANSGATSSADRANSANGTGDANGTNGSNSRDALSAGGKPAQPTSALPRWLSDNLLIFMTLVLTLIAFVIAWLLRRAGARRDDDEDDDMDEDLYATEIDPAAIDRRLDGIDLDLDSRPTDASVRREPGVAPRNPVRS